MPNWISPNFEPGLVSILVPTYNRADLIEETLDSTWAQTYRPIEVLIVDDGSADHTKEVAEAWIGRHADDPAFSASYAHQENAGVCAARNNALRRSRGEFIQFLDSDDIIHRERLEKVVDVFRSTGCDYVETGFEGFCSKCGQAHETHHGHTRTPQLVLLLTGRLWPNTLRPTYRRSLIAATGPWNEKMVTLQDYEYVIRALVRSPIPQCAAIHDVLASARRDTNGRMSDIIHTHNGRKLRIDCEQIVCDRLRELPASGRPPAAAMQAFAKRLYLLGVRSTARGWPDLGQRCGQLAEGLDVRLDTRGKASRLLWKAGVPGAKVYTGLDRMRRRFRDDAPKPHVCPATSETENRE